VRAALRLWEKGLSWKRPCGDNTRGTHGLKEEAHGYAINADQQILRLPDSNDTLFRMVGFAGRLENSELNCKKNSDYSISYSRANAEKH
jgi:hypothetical protein